MLFNAFSFVFIAVVMLALAAYLLWRAHRLPRAVRMAVTLALVGGAVLVWFAARPIGSSIDSVAAFEAQLGQGKPLLVEFFSEY